MCTILSRYIKKWDFVFWRSKLGTFCAISWDLYLTDFRTLSDFGFLKYSWAIFALLTQNWPKHMDRTTQTRNFSLTFFDLMTLDDLNLKYAHEA